MRLIVGLGNPGKKYQNTRHNLGFGVIDKLKQKAVVSRQKAILFKPQKFMNLSGQEVLKKINFYRLGPEDLIVIYDDIDLPLGTIRIRQKGRSGGHKGLQSIIDALNSQNFTRIKIGIGRPPVGIEAEEYVLEEFDSAEEKTIQKAIDEAAEKVVELVSKNPKSEYRNYKQILNHKF